MSSWPLSSFLRSLPRFRPSSSPSQQHAMRVTSFLAAATALASLVAAAPAISCTSRQFLDPATNTCKQCPTTMLACSSATVAITCARGRYMTPTKQCVAPNACPAGTYPSASTLSCKKCAQSNAKTCKDGSSTGSTSCIAGSCLSTNHCVYIARMGSDEYCTAEGVRASCAEGVSKCTAAGATACKYGYTLSSQGTCTSKCAAGETYVKALDSCTKPQASCDPATHVWNPVTKFCEVKCADGQIVNGRYEAAGYFVYAPGHMRCMPCGQPGARQCNFLGQATSCLEGYNQGDGYCMKCTSDQDWNAQTGRCECRGAAYTTDAAGKITITRTAMRQDPSTNAQSCIPCTEKLTALTCADGPGWGLPDVSTSCLPGFKLVSGSCNHCEDPTLAVDKATGQCRVCPAGDDSCEPFCLGRGTYTCQDSGYCFTMRPSTHTEPVNGECVSCPDGALDCDAQGRATSCIPSHGLFSGSCPPCRTIDPVTKGCAPSTCPDATYVEGTDGTVQVTEQAQFFNTPYQSCYYCQASNALRCSEEGKPTACLPGFSLSGEECV
ncbi:hypothetical protein DMC30DRAFT_231379 [Rhodotorula diobovata]|uniref:Uncharacterized protein n=1 Tax=Rhodotorula diobovata TaxID=5288 RepID=A0A5C5FXS5_9BASI|nr:hypothetical protein DMC30DRAFT_231379 [Rhodotorula diobovata]